MITTETIRRIIILKEKPFKIGKMEIYEAFKKVKKNKGAGGVDNISLDRYEINLKDNLYKLWNRMSSGSYYPREVRGVEIPKKNGKMRLLGIPTIEDRIAQMVVRERLEEKVEPIFVNESYGYRPNKSAIGAITSARMNCFKYPWLIEFDIVGLFDNINHDLLMKAVKVFLKEKWEILYIDRWLKSSILMPNGEINSRNKGTPQGGVISAVLANLFLHYAFDLWIKRTFNDISFERYADDGIIHCKTLRQAEYILNRLKERMKECGLEIHPNKTKIIYCKSYKNTMNYVNYEFTFLGYTFKPSIVKNMEGRLILGYVPRVSKEAAKKFRKSIKDTINMAKTSDIVKIAELINPIIMGWYNYFCVFSKHIVFRSGINYINNAISNWVKKYFKSCRRSIKKAYKKLYYISKSNKLFYHWKLGYTPIKNW